MNFDILNKGEHASSLDFTKAVEVTTGQTIDFTKENPGVSNLRIELYWESDKDGDVSVVLTDVNGRGLQGLETSDKNSTRGMVWYNNLELPGVKHSGDALTSNNDPSEPEEVIKVSLESLDPEANGLIVVASTYSEFSPVPFRYLTNCRVMVINDDTQEVIYVSTVSDIPDPSTTTSVELAAFIRNRGNWTYSAKNTVVGQSSIALPDVAKKYGIA